MDTLKKILKLTAGIGEVLTQNGAEISRVEDTMNRVALHYGVARIQVFIITNGVFVNLEMGDDEKNVSFRHIADPSVNLYKICQINELSREIIENDLSLDEALDRFHKIDHYITPPSPWHIAASGIGAAAFCYLFGGTIRDSAGALVMGAVLWAVFLILGIFHWNKVLRIVVSCFTAGLGCCLLLRFSLIDGLGTAIMGSVIPLIPGLAVVNGIRDIADGDYLSGSVRILDAVVVFASIALGVGLAVKLFGTGVVL